MRGRKPGLDTMRQRMAEPYTGPMPPCPAWLDAEARLEWDRVIPEVQRAGTFDPADMMTLAAYCQAYSAWMLCETTVRDEGLMIPGSNGNMVLHPAARHRVQLVSEMRKCAAELGITPAARTRVQAPPRQGAESDNFDAMA